MNWIENNETSLDRKWRTASIRLQNPLIGVEQLWEILLLGYFAFVCYPYEVAEHFSIENKYFDLPLMVSGYLFENPHSDQKGEGLKES